MDSLLTLISRHTSDRTSVLIIDEETVNKYGSLDEACSHISGKAIVCHSHKRSICPECYVGCEKLIDSGGTIELESAGTLQTTDGDVYIIRGGTRDGFLFSWSPTNTDDSHLAKLQASDDLSKTNTQSLASYLGWTPRFIPQWDEQVQGVKIWDLGRQIKDTKVKPPVPLPPNQLNTTYCEECQLTWVTGDTGTHVHSHPTHDALSTDAAYSYHIDQRSIIVHVAGENCSKGDGRKNGIGRLGIYFGKDSKYNHSEHIYLIGDSATRRCAEIHAARHALLIVKEQVIPAYMDYLERKDEPGSSSPDNQSDRGNATAYQVPKQYQVEKPFELELSSDDTASEATTPEESVDLEDYKDPDIRLVLATDSKNLIDLFCDQIHKWVYDEEAQEFRTKKSGRKSGKRGDLVKNNDIIVDFWNALHNLLKGPVGVQVSWYHIPRRFNDEAHELADASVDA
ncbi:hypothetical protein F5X99DRAFT_176753 [Biscogniauxia marginata]|nr:hypothetical protein F5X99DRAFT_176753 [Biscogniauxia marginata]